MAESPQLKKKLQGCHCVTVFGHIARLTQGTPAHNALHCQVGLASGRSLGRDWRSRPGRPLARWTDQLHNDPGSVPANLWRQAILRGHGVAKRRPELATRWRRRRRLGLWHFWILAYRNMPVKQRTLEAAVAPIIIHHGVLWADTCTLAAPLQWKRQVVCRARVLPEISLTSLVIWTKLYITPWKSRYAIHFKQALLWTVGQSPSCTITLLLNIFLRRINPRAPLQAIFGGRWSPAWSTLQLSGSLYCVLSAPRTVRKWPQLRQGVQRLQGAVSEPKYVAFIILNKKNPQKVLSNNDYKTLRYIQLFPSWWTACTFRFKPASSVPIVYNGRMQETGTFGTRVISTATPLRRCCGKIVWVHFHRSCRGR